MSLTICLLTRNAEDRIENALRSVADLGGELLVGDTGSSDQTSAAAQALGARVAAIAWQDDFGAAQNQLLDQATGDWVLWLNPDEVLLPEGRARLPELLAAADVLAYAVRVETVARAEQPPPYGESLQPRLFRRHPALRVVGRLHPNFAEPLEVVAGREKMRLALADLTLRQYAYLSTITEEKLRWAARLLELELRDRPGQLHYLVEYGRNLLMRNDPRGHEVLAEAADQVLAQASAGVRPSPESAGLLDYLLTVAPEQSRSRMTPDQVRGLVLRWFPTSPPLLWALAQRDFRAGDFRSAADLLERVLLLGASGSYDRTSAFDPSIMGEPARLNLGFCRVRLGDPDRAEVCFQALVGHPVHGARAEQGLAMVQQLRGARQAR